MTKKRLADLLREEAQKSQSPETEVILEAAPDQSLEPNATLSETEPETIAEPSLVNASAVPRAKRTGPPTKAELETAMAELREALQEAHRKENSLQQQIANLQSELQEQKTLVQKLQADLEQANHLKAELEQAKETILQLVKANSGTTQEVNTFRQDEDLRSQKLNLKRLPHHSIQTDSSSSKLSDSDIGWVD